MERDDTRGSEATAGLEREREQRGHGEGGQSHATSAAAEDARRADVERHQRENPTDFVARGHDEERAGDDVEEA